MPNIRKLVRAAIQPQPPAETQSVVAAITAARERHPGYPYCPATEGDFLYRLAALPNVQSALEVGFATGSTALYLLEGLAAKNGRVTSIDFRQSDFQYLGVENIKASPHALLHTLIEGNSNAVLPRLLAEGQQTDLIFLDGWKVYDHLLLDVYYSCRLLRSGGFLVFDDAIMPSTRKTIGLITSYYGFSEVDYAKYGETWRHRALFFATQGRQALHRPYRAFVKPDNFDALPALTQYNFWRPV